MGPKHKPPSGSTSSDGATLCSEWLKSSEDIVWGLAGDNFTRTFYRDAAIAHEEKWICLKDSKTTDKVMFKKRNDDESTMEVIFQFPNATKADSGEYTIGTGDSKALKMKTNITVRIIDKLKPFQPLVAVDKSDKVMVNWMPPVTDHLAIIGYDVECKEEGETRWTKVTPYKVKDCSFCDDDIAPNKVYIYRVIAYNKIGHPWLSQPSNEFPFKIEPPAPQAPKINASSTTSVTVGEPLELCVSITETCDDVTCTWKKDGINLIEGYVEDGKSVYRIEKATLQNAGEYIITAKNGSQSSKMKMNVVVQEAPAPMINASSTTSVTVGEPLELCVWITDTCDDVTWEKDGNVLIKGYVEDGKSVYRIEKSTLENAGEYIFTAKNGSQSAKMKMNVVVREPPAPLINASTQILEAPAPMIHASSTTSVTVGEPLELCVWITDTCDGVTWEKDGNVLIKGKVEEGKSVYGIEKATLEYAGEYTFTAMRGSKRSQMKMNVVVQEKKQENVLWNCIYYGPSLLTIVVCAIVMALYLNSSPNDTNLTTEIENIKDQLQRLSIPSGMEPNKWKIGLDDFDDGLTQKWNAVGGRLSLVETNASQAAQEINNIKEKLVNVTTIEDLLKNHTIEIQNLTNWVKECKTTFDSFIVKVEQLKKDFEAEKTETSITKRKIASLNETITPINEELKEFKKKYQALGKDFNKVDSATTKLQKLLDDNTDIITSVRSNAANRESAQIVIAIVFIIEVGLGFWIYRIHLKVGSKGGVGQTSSKTAKEVLESIPRSVSLDRSICVIGFNNSMSDFNRGMITGALQGMNVSVNYTVVTRHEQLQRLPHCRLYVMCTEFTERHVIIEEQGLGLGDLKRCTHDVIQRLQANMVIIYIHDPGSRSLPQGRLFNNMIHCVSSQPELVRLKEMNRFFSIYDKLTDNQIRSFKEIVNSCIQSKY